MTKPREFNINHYGIRGSLRRITEIFELANSRDKMTYSFADNTEAAAYQVPVDQYRQYELLQSIAERGLLELGDLNYDVSLVPHPTAPTLGVFAGMKGIRSVEVFRPKLEQIGRLLNTEDEEDILHIRIMLENNDVMLVASNDQRVRIKSLRYQMAPHIFISYVLNTALSGEIRLVDVQEVEGLHDVVDLQEMMRNCGFDKKLKNLFTSTCTKQRLRITNPIEMTRKETKRLFSRLERSSA